MNGPSPRRRGTARKQSDDTHGSHDAPQAATAVRQRRAPKQSTTSPPHDKAAAGADVLPSDWSPRPRSLVERFGGLYSRALGIDLRNGRRDEVFKWFLASLLFGARISETLGTRAWHALAAEGLTAPDAILAAGWDRLVQALDRGGYARYDFKTADKLLAVCDTLQQQYRGDLNRLHAAASDEANLEARLHALGKGIGAVTINIFLRELRGVWDKATPAPSERVLQAARSLHLLGQGTDTPLQALDRLRETWTNDGGTAKNFAEFEAALVRFERLTRGRRGSQTAAPAPSSPAAESRARRRRSHATH